MADQTEKPKLGTRPPLGIKRTVETGKVKQSFSHGRSGASSGGRAKPHRRPPRRPLPSPRRQSLRPNRPRPLLVVLRQATKSLHAWKCRRGCCAKPKKRA